MEWTYKAVPIAESRTGAPGQGCPANGSADSTCLPRRGTPKGGVAIVLQPQYFFATAGLAADYKALKALLRSSWRFIYARAGSLSNFSR